MLAWNDEIDMSADGLWEEVLRNPALIVTSAVAE